MEVCWQNGVSNLLCLNIMKLKTTKVSEGGISGTIADIKLIMSTALKCPSGLILVHNHPSGQLFPSRADKRLTMNIENACNLLEIELLDHLIISSNGYYSFTDDG